MVSKVAAAVGVLAVAILALIAILGTDGTAAAARQLSTPLNGNHAPSNRRLEEQFLGKDGTAAAARQLSTPLIGNYVQADRRLEEQSLQDRVYDARDVVNDNLDAWVEAGIALDAALVAHLPLHNQVRALRWSCSHDPEACIINMEQLWCNRRRGITTSDIVKDYLKCHKNEDQPPNGRRLPEDSPEVELLRTREELAMHAVEDAAEHWDQARTGLEDALEAHILLYNQQRLTAWGCSQGHCSLTVQQFWCNEDSMAFNKNIAKFLSCDGSATPEGPDGSTGLVGR